MYGECGSEESSRLVFDKMADRDIVSWSTMIRSCHKGRLFDEALELIRKMQFLKMRPSEVAMINMVNLFADIANIEMGKAIHACVMRNGKNEKLGVALATSLIDMYAKCGNLASAKRLFDGLDQRSVVSWTAMIAGYIRCKAGALDLGKWIHAYIEKRGVGVDVVMKTAVMDMYAKCGDIHGAHRLFIEATSRDICMWNALMKGYGMHDVEEEENRAIMERNRQ
ncbi:hypothetical protein Pint_20425 [Pistacia integerrima]|uniref:Uncharacterized protein n=1 Tax=Pistacia integerrima TaxID=434235 RepID=A0ACC0XD85_9ROSI|nr:hypothetical protein Pint_20425 [Pistacia integerrima]